MKKTVTSQQRKRQDYLRRKGLKVGASYMVSLAKYRHNEVKRVLGICRDFPTEMWPVLLSSYFKEDYLPKWYEDLYVEAGLPQAKSIVRDLTREKADAPLPVWEMQLRDYAQRRAGRNIVIVSGTVKDALRKMVGGFLEEDENIGIEALTRKVIKQFDDKINLWQCRRIAQTETMIGLAEASHEAAKSLDIRYTKEWCCSGLTNTRDTHLDMDGAIVDEDDYFELLDCKLLYPHDESMDPPAGEIINCACSCIRQPK